MKKIKKRIKRNLVINTSPAIRMSELIAEYASDYINMGETTEERQRYLNGACTAWNIAVLPDPLREKTLRGHIEAYLRMNPGGDDGDNLMHDIRILIRKKLQMFPDINKVIANALIEPINDAQYRIIVFSTERLK
jgi:hypothetical protein